MKKILAYLFLIFLAALACGQSDTALSTRASEAVLTKKAQLPPTFTPESFDAPNHAVYEPLQLKTATPHVIPASPIRPIQTTINLSEVTANKSVPLVAQSGNTQIPTAASLQVDGWNIRVERVNFFESLTRVGGDVERAAGRYLAAFLAVTNLKSYSRTFVAFGSVDVLDADGWTYEEDFMASSAAWWTFNTDIGADIPPGGTEHVVAVYDVHAQSSGYSLVPGWKEDTITGQIPIAGALVSSIPPTRRPDPWDDYYSSSGGSTSSSDYEYDSSSSSGSSGSSGCCKICKTGKACGNSCISRSYTCHKGPGCACNG